MKADHVILGVHITDRLHKASDVQAVFTEYGCNIKTRLGLHEVADNYCSPGGIVLLELVGDKATLDAMKAKLQAVPGLEVKAMVFKHD